MIIWNTDDVFLDDVNPFTGNPSSDIYVKGFESARSHCFRTANRIYTLIYPEKHLASR